MNANALAMLDKSTGELVPMQPQHETAGVAAAAQAKALVQARYEVAQYKPRDEDRVRERLLKECARPSFADGVLYRKPMGKKKDDSGNWVQSYAEGPSIRFAEAAIRCMGNVAVDTMAVYDDSAKRIVRVSVTDLEANITYNLDVTIQKTVERRQAKEGDKVISTRTNSYGEKVFILEATDDEILNKQAALISKAVRTNGLRVIPGDLVDECVALALRVQKDKDAKDPDAARRAILDAFASQGVNASQVKEYLGHDAATLTPKELTELRALYSALRDGESTWREVMDAKTPPPDAKTPAGDAPKGGTAKAKDALAKNGAKASAQAATPSAEAQAAAADAGNPPGNPRDATPGDDL